MNHASAKRSEIQLRRHIRKKDFRLISDFIVDIGYLTLIVLALVGLFDTRFIMYLRISIIIIYIYIYSVYTGNALLHF